MAGASRKISRKQLRQPDWFQETTEKAFAAFTEHRLKFFAALVAILVVGLIIAGWQIFKARQNTAASKEFGSALALYEAKKYQDAIADFKKVQGYRWSRYAALAYLYEADAYINMAQYDKATSPAERFLAATGPDTLYRQIALMTLGFVEERQNKCKIAIDRYTKAENINRAFQQEAILGRARCAQQLGNLAAAVSAYRDYVNENPGSWVALRLAELEAKASDLQTQK